MQRLPSKRIQPNSPLQPHNFIVPQIDSPLSMYMHIAVEKEENLASWWIFHNHSTNVYK